MPNNSELRQSGGYYAYGNSLGGGIVNSFNVRQFLNDPNNKRLIDDFTAYLETNATESEIVQIIGSNNKLSEIFNEFYESSVMQSSPTSSNPVSTNLSNSINIQEILRDHAWNGSIQQSGLQNIPSSIIDSDRREDIRTLSVDVSPYDDYHIPIFMYRSFSEIDREKYSGCSNIIHQFLNPELFETMEPSIEGEEGRIDGSMIFGSGDTVESPNSPMLESFSNIASELIDNCYSSDCMDNRYCDFLRNGRTLLESGGEERIREIAQSNNKQLTNRSVLFALIDELSNRGYPVVRRIYDCLISYR